MMEKDIEFGGKTLRLRPFQAGWKGIVVGQSSQVFYDETRTGLLRKMEQDVLQGRTEFVGHQAARDQFLKRFPLAFEDPRLVEEKTSELLPKRRAAQFMKEEVPLAAALIGQVDRGLFLKGMGLAGMIDKHDLISLGNLIHSDRGAELIAILAHFAADNVDQACNDLLLKFRKDGVANWSILTYPAAMWRPEAHAFLLRTAGRNFAKAVGHRFGDAYQSSPDSAVYSSYLSLLDEVRDALSDLEPTDYLDLETYVHVVMKYPLPAVP